MKIFILHHFGSMGGGTNSCIDIASILLSQGHEVTICISDPSSEVLELIKQKGVQVRTDLPPFPLLNYHSASRSRIKAMFKFFITNKFLTKWNDYLKELNPDLLLLNSIVQCPLIKVAKQSDIKCICFIRETIYGTRKSFCNSLISEYLKKADGLVYLTEYDKNSWNLGETVNQYVLPDIVDEERFRLSSLCRHEMDIIKEKNDWELSLLYFGGYNIAKGALVLIKAIQHVRSEGYNVGLYILGDCENKYNYSSLIKRIIYKSHRNYYDQCKQLVSLINEDSVFIEEIGLTGHPENWLYISDVIVFPVTQVHQARPVYEAGFFEKPAIVPDFINFQDAVKNGYNGLTYKIDDAYDLSRKIIYLLNNKSVLNELGINNKLLTTRNHSTASANAVLKEIINAL